MLLNHPLYFFIFSFLATALAVWCGIYVFRRRTALSLEVGEAKDFDTMLTATLTLLTLLIGFSFSIAISRYDVKKNYEEEEANAIGTEMLRVELLSPGASANAKMLLGQYLDYRIDFYNETDAGKLEAIGKKTGELQNALWASVLPEVKASQTAAMTLVASGMNDVINTQGYTQAAWWNKFPASAWTLLFCVALFSCVLIGYGAYRSEKVKPYLFIFPFIISLSMALVADIGSPRGGMIKVKPQNLVALQQSLS